MNTLTVNIVPTKDLNISKMDINLNDFDAHIGVSFMCTYYNSNGYIIDRKIVILGDEAWQEWGPSENDADDYNYVIDYCLNQLQLEKYIEPVNSGSLDEPILEESGSNEIISDPI